MCRVDRGQVLTRPLSNPLFVAFSLEIRASRLAQLVERVTSNDEVSRSNRLEGKRLFLTT